MVCCSSSLHVAGGRALGVYPAVFGSQICHFITCNPNVQEYLEHLQKGKEPGNF